MAKKAPMKALPKKAAMKVRKGKSMKKTQLFLIVVYPTSNSAAQTVLFLTDA
jgi:hypothetical protein